MTRTAAILAAASLLSVLAGVSLWTLSRDALTFDEKAHIAAGYSSLVKGDYRLNPEHPPLLKDLAALPLLSLDISFPDEHPAWAQDDQAPPWWAQFNVGNALLFEQGNDPRAMTVLSRLPMVLVLLGLALLVFYIAKTLGGMKAGLIALALASFSPTLVAHGRLVTTDTGAALGVLAVLWTWGLMAKNPSLARVLAAALVLGLALLTKFSLLTVLPVLALVPLIPLLQRGDRARALRIGAAAGIAGIAAVVLVVWPAYEMHIRNYPQDRQIRDTAADLNPDALGPARTVVLSMAEIPALRAPAQFLRGALMAAQRSAWGNTTFFAGEVSAQGNPLYFPVLFLLKTPLALSILLLLLLVSLLARPPTAARVREAHPFFLLSGAFALLYLALSVSSDLNIGIRHLLPIFPLLFIAIATAVSRLPFFRAPALQALLLVLLAWYASSSVRAFPFYLSYYNELVGMERGYEIAVDSNYDWGQDFHRLRKLMGNLGIRRISLDYFGGEDPAFWLGDAAVRYDPRKDPRPEGWFAVSVNQLQGGRARAADGFDQDTSYYRWLDAYAPVSRAGKSIFLYFIPPET